MILNCLILMNDNLIVKIGIGVIKYIFSRLSVFSFQWLMTNFELE